MDAIHEAFKIAQARIDAGTATSSDYAVTALLGKHVFRLLGDAGIERQSLNDRAVGEAIQAFTADALLFAEAGK